MKTKSFLKRLSAALLLAGLGLLIAWIIAHPGDRGKRGEEDESVRPEATHVSTEEGRTLIRLTEAEQTANGIRTTLPVRVSHRQEVRAYGSVIDLQGLIDMRTAYTMAKAKVVETRAHLDASGKEYARLTKLYKENRNVSEKSLQAAEALWRSDKAAVEASRIALTGNKNVIEQQWGTVIANWLFGPAPALERLTGKQDVLIQLTLSPESRVPTAPNTALVVRNGKEIEARLVSQAPRTDPRIQGVSYLYLAPASGTDLLAGMNVIADLLTGQETSGLVVPTSAVVWSEGAAWVYVAEDSNRFSRRRIPTDTSVRGGWFVEKALSPGDRIVTAGAQVLLSVEFRSKIQVED